MARYFAGNTLAAFKRSAVSIVESSYGNSFDAAYVANSITIANQGDFIESPAFIDAPSATTFWLTFMNTGSAYAGPNRMLTLLNSDGVQVLTLYISTANAVLYQWNGATYGSTQISTNMFAGSRDSGLRKVTIKVVCGASGSFDLYSGETLVGTLPITNAAVDNIAQVRIHGYNGNSIYHYFSEIMAADYDLRDARYMCKLPSGDGTYTDGTGSYASVDDPVLDDSDAVKLPVVGNKRSFTHGAIALPPGYSIEAAVMNVRGRIGGAPTDAKLFVKHGASEAGSAGLGFNTGYEPRSALFEVDPSTGAAFTEAGFNATEFGIEAA